MKKILIIGSTGQIGSELSVRLRSIYGSSNVICGYYTPPYPEGFFEAGPNVEINALHIEQIADTVKKYKIDAIYNLVATPTATAERYPQLGWNVGIGSLMNCLDVAREYGCSVFTPSSIEAFGSNTPKDYTPQDTIQRPQTIYGIIKVLSELISDYYFERWKVDTRSLRFPGIISNMAQPSGRTTDYAIEIFYKAVAEETFVCPLRAGTFLDMVYMPDALDAAINLMEADPNRLIHRNSFNITSMSFDPEMICTQIRRYYPKFQIVYDIDPHKQKTANSWPNSLDDSCARSEWGWKPNFDLKQTATDMIEKLQNKLGIRKRFPNW